MSMPKLPEIPFTEGDTVKVINLRDTRVSSNYGYLVDSVGVVTNPSAGSQPGQEPAIVEVRFPNGDYQWMFHWRLEIITREVAWEV